MELYFKSARDEDFLRAYGNVISRYGSKAPYISKSLLVREAIGIQPKRYYVSYEQAFRVLRNMMNGKEMLIKGEEKKLMYLEMFNLLKPKLETSTVSFRQAVCEVVNTPPSRFSITFKSAQMLLYTLLKNKA